MADETGRDEPWASQKVSWLERWMFRPVPLWILLLFGLLACAGTILFGALVLSGERGGRLRPFNTVAVSLAKVPFQAATLMRGSPSPFLSPSGAANLPGGFSRDQGGFVDPGYLLLTLYDQEKDQPFVRLVRLSDGAVLRDFRPDISSLSRMALTHAAPIPDYDGYMFRPGHPDLMDDGGLLFMGSSLLMARTDACDRTVWTRPGHHSIERDENGDIWSPVAMPTDSSDGTAPRFRDDGLVKTSADGRQIYARRLSTIFAENGLDALIVGAPYRDDPFHLNDVEPVLEDGPYWKRGDVFLSLRHLSMLILFRPSTGKVIWSKIGPWLGQHDVVILDPHRIAVFDNRSAFEPDGAHVRGFSRELVYDFSDGTITSPWEEGFRKLELRVPSNGRGLPLAGGDLFVEDTVHGQVVRFAPNGDVRWRYIQADEKGRRYWMFWSRYLTPERYTQAIKATLDRKCN